IKNIIHLPQLAAKNATEFSNASQLIYSYVDGVGLNCVCPQSWAILKRFRQLEKCGVSFITLHRRNMGQKSSEPLNVAAIQDVKQSMQVPPVVNGGVRTWQEACDLYEQSNADGIMVARGLLSNPPLFNPCYKNQTTTPLACVQDSLNPNCRLVCSYHFTHPKYYPVEKGLVNFL
ncbi:tRNA-dihydrouridine(20a/20b) synthase [NAD(P)+]-like, partial [Glossina fuscipes fuscipes]